MVTSVLVLILIAVVSVSNKGNIFSGKDSVEQPLQQQNEQQSAGEAITPNDADKKPASVEEQPVEKEPTKQTPAPNQKKETPEKNSPIVNEGGYIEGQKLPNNPTFVKGVLVVNKKNPLPANYAPGVEREAETALNTMFTAAKVNSFDLTAFSTFRSFEYQQQLYEKYVKKDGQSAADRYSARPGYSEHQSGLAFDIGEIGREELWLTEAFGESEAGKWLHENAHEYGFILRYPKGSEAITGYMYESWHFRYVGIKLATEIYTQKVTLEEYLNIQ